VQYLAGDGENVLIVESGSITIDSSATGTLDTTVKTGAVLTTSRLEQRAVTIEPGGRITLNPGGGTSVVTSLDLTDAVPVEETPPATVQTTREAEPIIRAIRNRAELNSPEPIRDEAFARWEVFRTPRRLWSVGNGRSLPAVAGAVPLGELMQLIHRRIRTAAEDAPYRVLR
jgi:hypothetical protein